MQAESLPGHPAPGPRGVRWRHPLALPSALLALAMCLRFWRYVGLSFYFDDLFYFDNFLKRGRLLDLLHPTHAGGYFRPLAYDLYLPIAFRLFGAHTWAYHLVQLALVLAQAWLLYRLGRELGFDAAPSWVASALYGLSQTHAVEIGWISCVSDALANTLVLATALAHLKGRRWTAALCFAGALLAKESAVSLLPGLVFLSMVRMDASRALRAPLYLLPVLVVWLAGWIANYDPLRLVLGMRPEALLAVIPALLLATLGFQPWVWPGNPVGTVAEQSGLLIAVICCYPALFPAAPAPRRALLGTAGFVLVMLVPILPASIHLSAYYFNLPLAGVFLILSALLWSLPPPLRMAIPALILVVNEGSLNWGSTPGVTREASGYTGWTLEMTDPVPRAFMRDLPAAVPAPASNTLFCFSDMPVRNGVVLSDTPLLRLIYSDNSLHGAYFGALWKYTMDRDVEFFRWDEETGRMVHAPASAASLEQMRQEAELTGQARSAMSLLAIEERRGMEPAWTGWPRGVWLHWNRGYLWQEMGDSARAGQDWRQAAALAGPADEAIRGSGGDPGSLPQAMGASAGELLYAPRDAGLLQICAVKCVAAGLLTGDELLLRSCSLTPADTGLTGYAERFFTVRQNSWAAAEVGRYRSRTSFRAPGEPVALSRTR